MTDDTLLLKVGAAGEGTVTESAWVEVSSTPPIAGFENDNVLGASEVNFTNISFEGTSYSWDFGDNSTSNEVSPTHNYEEDGTYEVVLIVTNDCGSDTTTQQVVILTPPDASFTTSDFGECGPFTVTYEAAPQGEGLTYNWFFEGGTPMISSDPSPTVSYADVGFFDVTLTVTNAAGSTEVVETDLIMVNLPPVADFELNYNIGENSIALTNTSTNPANSSWGFGDGMTSTDPNPNHAYLMDGTYLVTLIEENNCGADTTFQEVTIITPPKVSFELQNEEGCAPLTVQFENTTPNADSIAWHFPGGDPSFSNAESLTVTYNEPGSYEVSLEAFNEAGMETQSETNLIVVAGAPETTASFEVDNLTVNFASQATGDNLSYDWMFGDGAISSDANPSHTYEMPGNYTATLIVSNDCGADTVTLDLELIIDQNEEVSWLENLNLYPNPNHGTFTLILNGTPTKQLRLGLIDVVGRKLSTEIVDFNVGHLTKTFDFRHLPAGVYILEIEAAEQAIYRKVVIE